MAVFDLYSKRRARETKGGTVDVYQYDSAPESLRNQIVHIFQDAYDAVLYRRDHQDYFRLSEETFKEIVGVLCREYGKLYLVPHHKNKRQELLSFLLSCEMENFLDCVEILCRLIENDQSIKKSVKDAHLSEVNVRFREAAVGYEFVEGMLIRIDNALLHNEVVKPAITLLGSHVRYRGAEDELFQAFDHYRRGEHKEAIANSLKSFESCMKAILQKREWAHSSNDTASKLLQSCFTNGLLPPYMQSHFNNLQALLASGVPTVRNKTAGHGQGVEPITVPDYLVSYIIHTAAANIKLLIECEKSLD